ncbi:MAG: MBOAT family protein [Clostridia bacterium]|nr:MBOAT family protein [Clostridia bacterium]
MVFSSLTFLCAFLPLVVLLYYACKKRTWRNAVLLVFSLLFYAWGEPKYIFVMLASVLVAYLGGFAIEFFKRREKQGFARAAMVVTTVILVGCLVVFKYLGLFAETFRALFSQNLNVVRLVLPIGISFYTFQILSYVIDLYWGKVVLQKNYFTLLLYLSFFPQLIAGPIVRYETVEDELKNRKETWQGFVAGLEKFIFGLAKKVLLANNLARLADGIYGYGIEKAGTLFAWVAVIAYTLQIYFDFSGYSDMAIGMGRMFGFHFPQNFNYPYIATSVTDFWRRWHISLSTWFRDYIYIPLGGNRVKPWRHAFNLLVTWALTGFWHGAQWSFLLWGLYYAALLLLEKFVLAAFLKKLPKFFGWLYTLFFVVIGWVIFYNESVWEIVKTLGALFVPSGTSPLDLISSDSSLGTALLFLPVSAVFAFPVLRRFLEKESPTAVLCREAICLVLFVLSFACLISSTYNPFIYFRF